MLYIDIIALTADSSAGSLDGFLTSYFTEGWLYIFTPLFPFIAKGFGDQIASKYFSQFQKLLSIHGIDGVPLAITPGHASFLSAGCFLSPLLEGDELLHVGGDLPGEALVWECFFDVS